MTSQYTSIEVVYFSIFSPIFIFSFIFHRTTEITYSKVTSDTIQTGDVASGSFHGASSHLTLPVHLKVWNDQWTELPCSFKYSKFSYGLNARNT